VRARPLAKNSVKTSAKFLAQSKSKVEVFNAWGAAESALKGHDIDLMTCCRQGRPAKKLTKNRRQLQTGQTKMNRTSGALL
jgi:hypothetical protein